MYDVGDSITLTAEFLSDLDAPIDPTVVTLVITLPDGTTSTLVGLGPLVNPSVGHWEHPMTFTMSGVWRWQWSGVGPGTFSQVEQGAFVVGGPNEPHAWISADDVFDGTACHGVTSPDMAIAFRSAGIASYVLWALSGRQFPGIFTDTVRPCRQTYAADWLARLQSDWWSTLRPWGTCGCGVEDSCGCSGLSQLKLPGTALLGIFEVKVDGVVLDPSAYRIDDYDRLVRIDGDRWPCCQDLSLADTELNTFSVSYAQGREPPEAGKQAARDLACELYRGAVGGECALPKRVSTITRQGISMTILDPFTFLDKGKVGIYSVDLWLSAVNPKHNQRPATVMSPDVGRRATRTGT